MRGRTRYARDRGQGALQAVRKILTSADDPEPSAELVQVHGSGHSSATS